MKVLSSEIPEHAISAWFEPIKAVGMSNSTIIIEVPNKFSCDWIDTHYKEELLKALNKNGNDQISYRLKVSTNSLKEDPPSGFSIQKRNKMKMRKLL